MKISLRDPESKGFASEGALLDPSRLLCPKNDSGRALEIFNSADSSFETIMIQNDPRRISFFELEVLKKPIKHSHDTFFYKGSA
jgi:hypothetical protein